MALHVYRFWSAHIQILMHVSQISIFLSLHVQSLISMSLHVYTDFDLDMYRFWCTCPYMYRFWSTCLYRVRSTYPYMYRFWSTCPFRYTDFDLDSTDFDARVPTCTDFDLHVPSGKQILIWTVQILMHVPLHKQILIYMSQKLSIYLMCIQNFWLSCPFMYWLRHTQISNQMLNSIFILFVYIEDNTLKTMVLVRVILSDSLVFQTSSSKQIFEWDSSTIVLSIVVDHYFCAWFMGRSFCVFPFRRFRETFLLPSA